MYVTYQLLGTRLRIGLGLGALGGTREGGFVVETVQVATRLLELLDPFLRLWVPVVGRGLWLAHSSFNKTLFVTGGIYNTTSSRN